MASIITLSVSNSSNFNEIREKKKKLEKINSKTSLGIYWEKRKNFDEFNEEYLGGMNTKNFLSIALEEEGIFDFSALLQNKEKLLCNRGVKCQVNIDHFLAFAIFILARETGKVEINIEKIGLIARYVKLMQQY